MTFSTVSLRVFTAGVALAAACGLAACGGTTTGTAAPASAPATVTVTASQSDAPTTSPQPSTAASSSPSSSPSSSARPSRPSPPDTSEPPTAADPADATEDDPVDATVEVAAVDQATAVWLDTACTDLTTLLPVLLAIPALDQTTTPVGEFRTAYRDYYATLADTALQVNDHLAQIDPPAVADGQALHEGYQYYLLRLADITGSGSIAIDQAADIAGIEAAVEQIQFEVDELGQEDIGLNSFSGGELQAYMQQIPSCSEFVTS